jgi:DNA-binding NarL/FixJ family response regulator
MLLGRDREFARLDAQITQVRAGTSAVLVVTGEAGVGKTSLLDYAVAHSSGLQVLRAKGIMSERNLPFAGLCDLLRPVLGHLGALPRPQRAALAAALAIGPAVRADRFAICAATLSLLGEAAARRPVLAVVDDVHWLDAASAQALEFTARRLSHDAIGLLIAARIDVPSSFDTARMNTMAVTGLNRAAARELLARTGRSIAPAVADRLVSGTGGNPLALLELTGTLTDDELTGLGSLPEPLPVATAVQHAFAHRLDATSSATRQLLLVAACDATADLATLQQASGRLGLDLADLASAEQAGLVRLKGGTVEFTHPLLRSAAYHAAEPEARQAAHRALADSIDAQGDPVRRAWHLAAAAVGPDEDVAASLDRAAQAAHARNAFVAASRAYQRAAELTADPSRQVAKWMAAGQAACLGGDLLSADRLLNQVIKLAADPGTKADAQAMLAYATLWTSPPIGQYHQLIADAEAVQPFDKRRAATLLALASAVCIMIGRLDVALRTATRAVDLSRSAGGIAWLTSQASLAHASILTGSRETGRRLIADTLTDPGIGGPDLALQLLRMRCGQALIWCEEYQPAEELLTSSVAAGRATGRLDDLPYGLATLSDLHFRTGEWSLAYAHAAEAVELSTDYPTNISLSYALVCAGRIDAAMGAARVCRDRLAQAVALARPIGVVSMSAYAAAASGLLELGAANYGLAAAELARVDAHVKQYGVRDPCVIQWRPDYIESLIRLGRVADAQEQLAVLEAQAAAADSTWATAAAARCRGMLLKPSPRAISKLEEAVTLAEASASIFEQARSRLCLGETLRRFRRRGEAGRQLNQAYIAFELLGAQPWAEHTAAELATAGVTAVPQGKPIHIRLTPQELRVALQVAEGLSNREVAARLFLSHKTIEVHLDHIYYKLGVRSRTSLARLVHSGAVQR